MGLSWTAPTVNAAITDYEYRHRADGAVSWSEWTSTGSVTAPAAVSPLVVDGLSSGTTYEFQVRALATVDSQDLTGTISATASGATAGATYVPGAPTGLTATQYLGGVTLSWTPPEVVADTTAAAEFYHYQVSSISGVFIGPAVKISGDGSTISHNVIELAPGVVYYFRLRAGNSKGDSANWSAEASASPRAPADGTWTYRVVVNPQKINPGDETGAQVSLVATWAADSGDRGEIVSLSVRGTGSVQAEVASVTPQLVGFGSSSIGGLSYRRSPQNTPGACTSSTQDTVEGRVECTITLTNNTNLLYAKDTALAVPYPVTAKLTGFSMTAVVNGVATAANTPDSDPRGSLSLGEAEPQPPTGLRETARASRQVSLAWDNPGNPQIDRYEYQTSTTLNDGEIGWPTRWTNIPGSGPDTVSRAVTGLTNNVTNYIRIRAVNDQSETGTRESGPSNTVEAIPNPTPAAPRNLRLSPEVTKGLNIGLLWDSSIDTTITAYQVRRSADGGANWSPDWTDLPATATGTAYEGHEFGTEYTFEVRAVNPVAAGAVSRITNTPTRNGAAGSLSGTSCAGNAAGAGFGDAASIASSSNYYGFDIVAAGVDPTDGSHWWQVEYMQSVGGSLDTFHQDWFPQDCFAAVSNAVADSVPATWPLVKGEWSFEATIDPNPLPSGDENGAEITFRAIYEVTSGDATELSVAIAGTGSPSVTASLSENDGGKLGFGQSLDDISTTPTGRVLQTDVCSVDLEAGTITCAYVVSGVYAKANATPKAYGVVLDLSPDDLVFEAMASYGEYQSFRSATATKSDVDGDGRFDLQLQVIPGLPEAPDNLAATDGNSRVTLEWDDPVNPNITGYEYQKATTQPGVTLSWVDPGDTTITKYQYRHTTTEPGIVLEWSIPSSLVLGDSVVYEYRQTTDVDTSDPVNSVGDFTGVEWTPILNSELFTTSYKVTAAEIPSLDLRVTNYFEVRPVKDGSRWIRLTH